MSYTCRCGREYDGYAQCFPCPADQYDTENDIDEISIKTTLTKKQELCLELLELVETNKLSLGSGKYVDIMNLLKVLTW